MAQQSQANYCNSVVIITDQPKFNSTSAQENQKWGTVIESVIDNVSLLMIEKKFFLNLPSFYVKNFFYDSHSKNKFLSLFPYYVSTIMCACIDT